MIDETGEGGRKLQVLKIEESFHSSCFRGAHAIFRLGMESYRKSQKKKKKPSEISRTFHGFRSYGNGTAVRCRVARYRKSIMPREFSRI